MSKLSEDELKRVLQGVNSAFLVPFIDDVEDFVWESIWHDVKGIASPNRLARTKKLFDVVDSASKIGWSAKTLKVSAGFTPGKEFEFVIQRADIIKKQNQLGFSGLTVSQSNPQDLGAALLAHWRQKVTGDAKAQGVEIYRVAILLKNDSRTSFLVIEEELEIPDNSDLSWKWTNDSKVGLQGILKSTGMVKYRWYPNQTQLFERLVIPTEASQFQLVPTEIQPAELRKLFQNAGYID